MSAITNRLVEAKEGLGNWFPVLFIVAYVTATVLFIPASALTLVAGGLFGLGLGSVYVSIASTLGATLAFLLGRHTLRRLISSKIAGNEKFSAIDDAVGKEGWKIVVLTRLSPAFPFGLLNYAYGLTKVPLPHYVLASWIGMMPGTVLYVYLGAIGKAAANAQGRTPGEWAMLTVGLAATAAVTIYITKVARSALNQHLTTRAQSEA
ncbi:MAG: TVP38/TMEM64 family protein [Verrucomicrobiae bacterium]|nr:TVP38/TMEM64 family protein [Verrucomicrobiae bacterium]